MTEWERNEEKWRKKWEESRMFEANPDIEREKCFVTFPFPYMNGPLHIGHAYTATRLDVYARFMRMRKYNTLFPWAWHWTGEPILGAALRIKKGDKELVRALREVDAVPEQELEKFVDPIYMAEYYTREGREALKKIGFSIDWRREFHTTSLEPTFSRLVEWQYETLRKKGYVTKGTHPVVWCPNDESPTGDHDRLEGEGVFPEEYTLLKFKFNEKVLPAATFRPETIYGVTNIFVNPDALYVEAEVDGEKWVISREAALKLSEQLKKVKTIRKFRGKELVGATFIEPIMKRELPILPGWFVDPQAATGIVYSVPAHAPADWIALVDLMKRSEDLKKYGLDPKIVKKIEPISLIDVEGYGDYPAIEIVKRMGIKDQLDPNVNEATSIIYKKEFHYGILKPICGKYSGKNVREAKAQIIDDFKKVGIADSMYDLPEKVLCRCTTRCLVKILSDQWFLKYSDPKWKKLTHEAIEAANIFPENARSYFHDKIDWLRDWACARRTGLGTPLPWSPGWIVETLSDSTIYMIFYTIVSQIRRNGVKTEQLTDDVFDFVFLGKGRVTDISERTLLRPEVLKEMRDEFLYWYPVDLRVSAKELVPNHLSFFLFQHVAMFPREKWPQAVGVNGMLTVEGQKMSKSKGNFLTLKDAIAKFGADTTRLALVLGAEDMNDPDWREEEARSIGSKLNSLRGFVKQVISYPHKSNERNIDRWLLSRIYGRVKEVSEAIETLRTRTAAEIALFEIWNDFRWYLRRTDHPSSTTLVEATDLWIRLLAPFTPFICEELWHALAKKELVSVAEWPLYDVSKIDVEAESLEEIIKSIIEDTVSVIKATKITPQKICFYVASSWKWKVYFHVLKKAVGRKLQMAEIMRELNAESELKKVGAALPRFVIQIMKDINSVSDKQREMVIQVGSVNEKRLISKAKNFLEKEFNASILIFNEEEKDRYDPKSRASIAKPYRPAIYIE